MLLNTHTITTTCVSPTKNSSVASLLLQVTTACQFHSKLFARLVFRQEVSCRSLIAQSALQRVGRCKHAFEGKGVCAGVIC